MENLSGKTILITGGTGFIGKPLCQTLIQQGARVFVFARPSSRKSSPDITYITSFSDLNGVAPDIIINLAGEPIAQRWTARAKDKIRTSRLGITRDIVDYIQSLPRKPSLFISASAIGYYGTAQNLEFVENTPASDGSPFSRQLCADWESEAQKAEHYGVRTVRLRLGVVLEKDGGMLAKLLLPFRLGLGGPIGDGQQWLSWIDRDDLIRLMLHVVHNDTLHGALNATAPGPVTNQDFSQTLAGMFNKPCVMRTPALVLRVIFGAMADELMLTGQKVLPQRALESGFVFRYPHLHQSLGKILGSKRNV